MNRIPFVRLNEKDNVAVAGADFAPGTTVEVDGVVVIIHQAIPAGHKFALAAIPAGSHIIKYGEVIGVATQPIRTGDHVHLHNLHSLRDSAQAKEKLR